MTCVISASRFTLSISKSISLCSCPRSRVFPSSSLSLHSSIRKTHPFCSASMSQSVETNSVSTPDDAGAKAEETPADVLIQYVVLRRDLIDSWPLGSVVTQGCHASVSAIWLNKDDPHTSDYCNPHNIDSMHKVTLEVKGETQMVNLSEKLKANSIVHKLWIEQPENIPTCLATKPYPKSVVSPFFKKLKLFHIKIRMIILL
ncbi:putative peptidyl-tRNA hydrolase PTRHD1 isoform X1 [Cucumis sativus]|uniref:putative peptidyl-tRNA hydrolase PTRHD1 isoform X1 n=2 Tax=Cucumis sativus TaxID=3659 RepID=UPI0012F487D9|nr:putative peptidyl-tRNA hydrolase PTRHD1 isoform X1 [Cucumis sativus]